MKKIYVYIAIIALLFSGCETSSSSNSPKHCKENGYSGMVILDSDSGDAKLSCSDGEVVNGYYKTSNGMKKVTSVEHVGLRSQGQHGHYYLEFK